jgi:hypothetical protein
MKTTFALTPQNAAVIEKWAQLIGWTPAEFLNEVLRETLEMFEDEESGYAEQFLGAHYYSDRESVERAVAWIVASLATQKTKAPAGRKYASRAKSANTNRAAILISR